MINRLQPDTASISYFGLQRRCCLALIGYRVGNYEADSDKPRMQYSHYRYALQYMRDANSPGSNILCYFISSPHKLPFNIAKYSFSEDCISKYPFRLLLPTPRCRKVVYVNTVCRKTPETRNREMVIVNVTGRCTR
jgi:hypothetical protein